MVYPLFIVTFYLHYFVIIPRMIKKPSFSSISKWFFVFFIIFAIRRYIANTILYDIGEYSPPLTEIWKWIILGVISNSAGILAVSLGSRYVKNKSKLKDLERQKVKNELSTLKNQIDIPDDSALAVSSEGLLGGNFIEIIPGASYEYMQPGDEFLDTQGSVSLISLLLKFVSGSDN